MVPGADDHCGRRSAMLSSNVGESREAPVLTNWTLVKTLLCGGSPFWRIEGGGLGPVATSEKAGDVTRRDASLGSAPVL